MERSHFQVAKWMAQFQSAFDPVLKEIYIPMLYNAYCVARFFFDVCIEIEIFLFVLVGRLMEMHGEGATVTEGASSSDTGTKIVRDSFEPAVQDEV